MMKVVLITLALAALVFADSPYKPDKYIQSYSHPAYYKFDWAVKDDYYNDYGQYEAREKDNTQGSYWVLMPDGRKRVIDYKVDAYGGFEIVNHRIEGYKEDSYKKQDYYKPSYKKPKDYKPSYY